MPPVHTLSTGAQGNQATGDTAIGCMSSFLRAEYTNPPDFGLDIDVSLRP
jgi:hypothetical protein